MNRKRKQRKQATYSSDLSAVSFTAGGSQVTTAVSFPGSATFSLDGGHLIFGGSVSKTNSWKITRRRMEEGNSLFFGRSVTLQNMNTERQQFWIKQQEICFLQRDCESRHRGKGLWKNNERWGCSTDGLNLAPCHGSKLNLELTDQQITHTILTASGVKHLISFYREADKTFWLIPAQTGCAPLHDPPCWQVRECSPSMR